MVCMCLDGIESTKQSESTGNVMALYFPDTLEHGFRCQDGGPAGPVKMSKTRGYVLLKIDARRPHGVGMPTA